MISEMLDKAREDLLQVEQELKDVTYRIRNGIPPGGWESRWDLVNLKEVEWWILDLYEAEAALTRAAEAVMRIRRSLIRVIDQIPDSWERIQEKRRGAQ